MKFDNNTDIKGVRINALGAVSLVLAVLVMDSLPKLDKI